VQRISRRPIALAERDRLKRAAATKNPQTDTNRETAARVKRAGDGAWGSHPDAIYGANSGKRRQT
jgi:hypothetical protein